MRAESTRINGNKIAFQQLQLSLFDAKQGEVKVKTPEGYFDQKKRIISGDKEVNIRGESFSIDGLGFEIKQKEEIYIIHQPHVIWKKGADK